MADQQQLYSSISEMKIATRLKVEVFTERRTGEKKKWRETSQEGELCNLYGPFSRGAQQLNLTNHPLQVCRQEQQRRGGVGFIL